MEEITFRDNCLSAELSEDYSHPMGAFAADTDSSAYYAYINAATCPDCGSGMVRTGSCFNCPSCGFGTCSV